MVQSQTGVGYCCSDEACGPWASCSFAFFYCNYITWYCISINNITVIRFFFLWVHSPYKHTIKHATIHVCDTCLWSDYKKYLNINLKFCLNISSILTCIFLIQNSVTTEILKHIWDSIMINGNNLNMFMVKIVILQTKEKQSRRNAFFFIVSMVQCN